MKTDRQSPEIISIGFDGVNRSGKGTQIGLLSDKFAEIGIPYLVVRGDGSRPNEGKTPGDAISEWWSHIMPTLRNPANQDSDIWNQSSERLARELIVHRDRTLPAIARRIGKSVGVLLVDRTLLSRTMTPRSQDGHDNIRPLYSLESGVTPEDVCPDIIFHLQVPEKMLLSRLDKNDAKHNFRRRLIEEKHNWYSDAHTYLPDNLYDRIIAVDGSPSPEVIHEKLVEIIYTQFPILKQ